MLCGLELESDQHQPDDGDDEPTPAEQTDQRQPGTMYYYRVVATNADGTSYGAWQSFTTLSYTDAFTTFTVPTVTQVPIAAFTFPVEEVVGGGGGKSLTNAQKLAGALKVCAKKSKKKRVGCEKRAHKRYAAKHRK